MQFAILGPLEVHCDGRRIDIVRPQRRAVLGYLASRVNRVVSAGELIDAVWGDAPPKTVRTQVHAVISGLRQSLSSTGLDCLRTGPTGYTLHADDGQLDATRFRRHVVRARDLAARDGGREAARELRAGLALWRGEVLAGVDAPFVWALRAPAEEERFTACEALADIELTQGRHREVIPELTAWLELFPTRESIAERLVAALCRSGRQADALEVIRRVRLALADELGVDLGPGLAKLQTRALALDPDLFGPGWLPAAPRPPELVSLEPIPARPPRQLPPAPRSFVGRAAEIAAMSGALRERDGAVLLIVGAGGIGKTTLALAWSHQVAEQFPDGQLYVNLRGFDPAGRPVRPEDAVTDFLHALGIPHQGVPPTPAARTALYRSLVADKRLLVVLDNAAEGAQVRELLPAGRDNLTVVTSRDCLGGLVTADGAQPLRLAPLTAAESLDLLTARLGPHRVAGERSSIDELVTGCAGWPLALAIVAARLAVEPELQTAHLSSRLRDRQARLAELAVAETATDLRAVFSWSFRRLSPAASALLIRLGLHPGPSISADAAARMSGDTDAATDTTLRELLDAHLLTPAGGGRFQLHDLLRLYAGELAHTELDPSEAREVRRRLLDHYWRAAFHADRLLNPARTRSPITPPAPSPTDTAPPFDDETGAVAWLDAEREVLIAVSALAAEEGFDEHAAQLPWTLATYLNRRGDWHAQARLLDQAVAAARRLGDLAALARILCEEAKSQWRHGDTDTATAHLHEARELCQKAADHAGLAWVERVAGLFCEARGEHHAALQHAERSLALAQLAGDITEKAQSLNALSCANLRLDRHHEVLDRAREGLALYEQIDSRSGQADLLDRMARACHSLGRDQEALAYHHRSAAGYAAVGDHHSQALELARIATVHDTAGDHGQASEFRKAAWAIVDELNLADDDTIRNELRPRNTTASTA